MLDTDTKSRIVPSMEGHLAIWSPPLVMPAFNPVMVCVNKKDNRMLYFLLIAAL